MKIFIYHSNISIYILIFLQTNTYDGNVLKTCMLNGSDHQKTIYHIIFFSTSYLIPLILITGLYVRMCIRLWRTVVGGNMSAESQRGRKRVTRLVVVVVFAFAIVWFPIQVCIYICIYIKILMQGYMLFIHLLLKENMVNVQKDIDRSYNDTLLHNVHRYMNRIQ